MTETIKEIGDGVIYTTDPEGYPGGSFQCPGCDEKLYLHPEMKDKLVWWQADCPKCDTIIKMEPVCVRSAIDQSNCPVGTRARHMENHKEVKKNA